MYPVIREHWREDLRFLRKGGMEVRAVRCIDMFPETGHVETVVQLISKEKSIVS